ncbi:hypothetical protein [Microbulbifer variabilis]|uniref:hypothetical protein n=1 Tax=Microbulbifer variabilis TaxID=266805 RepID=UPI001CFEF846|nr:hypothetical protein [Microbulbifer variabilis]
MGIWSGVKSLFSSNAKPIDDILDKENGLLVRAGGWIDGLSYTDQESADDAKEIILHAQEARKQIIDTVVAHVESTASENTQRSLTRRFTALAIIRVEMFLVIASVVVWPWNSEYAKFIWSVAGSMLMFGAFSAVIIFFFGSYGVGQHIMKPLAALKGRAKGAVQ